MSVRGGKEVGPADVLRPLMEGVDDASELPWCGSWPAEHPMVIQPPVTECLLTGNGNGTVV